MGSHSVTCHPTEVRIPPLPPAEAGTRFSDPGGMQGWVDLWRLSRTHLLNWRFGVDGGGWCDFFRGLWWQATQKQIGLRQWGLTYIHTCWPTSTRRAIFHERRISSVTFVVCLPFRATGNSNFETEKFPPAQRKIPENSRCLSSLIITVSVIPARSVRPAFPM